MARSKAFDEAAVLNKAMLLFWEKGYHATSVQDLVDHLGINRASLYATYGDKMDLYDAALRSYKEETLEAMEKGLHSTASLKEAFKQLFYKTADEELQATVKKGCFMANCTTEMAPIYEQFKDIIAENRQRSLSIIQARLQRAKEDGQLGQSQDVDHLANYLFTFMSGIKVATKSASDAQQVYQAIDTALEVLEA